jgi:hypothetical protein
MPLTWLARIGPPLAAEARRRPGALSVALEGCVREHLEELADERVEF